jgi:hypothetical protein
VRGDPSARAESERDGALHRRAIARMAAAGDVHDRGERVELVGLVGELTEVDVQVYARHGLNPVSAPI